MKKLIVCLALLGFLQANARAGVILATTGSPVSMIPGSTSNLTPMDVNVSSVSGTYSMAAWEVTLQISSIGATTGNLTFNTPVSGTPSVTPNPPNYIFAPQNGSPSIYVTNSGGQLQAFDLDNNGGTLVPSTPANLLQLTFLASAGASGRFGIYAVPGDPVGAGVPITYWNDSTGLDQQFANVAGGGANVQIGEVDVTASVPEPSTLTLLGIGIATMAGWGWRRKKLPLAS
jgi:hypothetical protein